MAALLKLILKLLIFQTLDAPKLWVTFTDFDQVKIENNFADFGQFKYSIA